MWPDKVGLKKINNKNKQTNKQGQASSVARHSSWKEVPVCSSVSRSSSRRASGGGGGACEELAGTELCTWEFSYIHTRANHADSAFAVSCGYLHKHFRYTHIHLDFSKPASILYIQCHVDMRLLYKLYKRICPYIVPIAYCIEIFNNML